MSPPPTAILRPAALGLSAGAVIGALYLAAKAMVLSSFACTEVMTPEGCTWETEIAAEMARSFYFVAIGLLFVGVGVFVFARKKKQ